MRRTSAVLVGVLAAACVAVAPAPAAMAAPEDTLSLSVPATVQGINGGCVNVQVAAPYSMKSRGYDNPRISLTVTRPDGTLKHVESANFTRLIQDTGTVIFNVPLCDTAITDASGTYTVKANLFIADYDYCIYDWSLDEAFCAGIEGIVTLDAAPASFAYFAPVDVTAAHQAKVSRSRRTLSAVFTADALPTGHPQGTSSVWEVRVNGTVKRTISLAAGQTVSTKVALSRKKTSLVEIYRGATRVQKIKVKPRASGRS